MLTLATDVKFLLISLSAKSILNHFVYFIHFSLSHFFGNFLSRSILYVQCVVCPLSALGAKPTDVDRSVPKGGGHLLSHPERQPSDTNQICILVRSFPPRVYPYF